MSSTGRWINCSADHPEIAADKELAVPPHLIIARTSYPHGHVTPIHQHQRARFLQSVSGVVVVPTSEGNWMVPAGHGLLIPAGAEHHVRMMSDVALQTLDIDRCLAARLGEKCFVIAVAPLLQSLIEAASDRGPDSEFNARGRAIAELLLHEVQHRPRLPLSLPLPSDRALLERCADFLLQPNTTDTVELWSSSLNMSRRSFTRKFKNETGLSFVNWRQRACLITAIPRLAQGDMVRRVALSLGFERSASFTVMFKRWLGATPKAYRW